MRLTARSNIVEQQLNNFKTATYDGLVHAVGNFFQKKYANVECAVVHRDSIVIVFEDTLDTTKLVSGLTACLCAEKHLPAYVTLEECGPQYVDCNPNLIASRLQWVTDTVMQQLEASWTRQYKNNLPEPLFPGMEDTIAHWTTLSEGISKPSMFTKPSSLLRNTLIQKFQTTTTIHEITR